MKRSHSPRGVSPGVIVDLPFREVHEGQFAGTVELDLGVCPWAGVEASTEKVWVSPEISGETSGYSAGKAEDLGNRVLLRGGL